MRQLQPLMVKNRYWRGIEAEIRRIWDELIFKPLAAVLGADELRNTGDALLEALREGTVWYDEGRFFGKFNARISKALAAIRAIYNPASGTWSLARAFLPDEVRTAQASADNRYEKLRRAFLTTLDDINIGSIDHISTIPDRYVDAIDWIDGDFAKTVRAITIPPDITDVQRGRLAAEWGQNLDKYVKDWAAENILKMRQMVEANAFEGRRASSLVKMLQQNYGVSKRKAEFLARQETALLMSKFQETRYADIGVTKYRWSTSHDERVREDHKLLNGEVFSFDQPPVTDRRTGARNNPGEDFNCRCIAIPLVE